jgi:hypothetical protein
MRTTSNNRHKLLSMATPFFILEYHARYIFFLHARHLLIDAWSLKLIRPITTSLCVSCIAMWKHFMSSLWMDVTDFIFRLFHISNLPSLVVLIALRLPCTPFANCAHLSTNYVNSSTDYEKTSVDCTNFSIDCGNKFIDCINTLDD